MDFESFDDFIDVEQSRHHASKGGSSDGASNHAFADGSVRLLKFGEAFSPFVLWAVEPDWRNPFLAP